MKIKFFAYGWKIQVVRCAWCNSFNGLNIGCKDSGTSHGLCDNCLTDFRSKKAKQGFIVTNGQQKPLNLGGLK